MKINPEPFFCGVLNPRRKRNDQTYTASCGGLRRCWIKSVLSKFFSFKGFVLNMSKGFTLIELLIVIAILGVLATGVLVAIDPVDKINAANDARAQSDIGILASASEAYATANGGFYPGNSITTATASTYAGTTAELVAEGEIKVVPVPATGYTYTIWSAAGTTEPTASTTCIAGRGRALATCKRVVIETNLTSKKYSEVPFQRYESYTGKTCQVAAVSDDCP